MKQAALILLVTLFQSHARHMFLRPSSHVIPLNEIDPANWMALLAWRIGNLTLQNLTLPGTHDTATFALQRALAPSSGSEEDVLVATLIELAEKLQIPVWEFVLGWSQAQNQTVYDQLVGGIRYVDLRACWDGSDWRIHHLALGPLLKDSLSDVSRFVHEHPRELVVLEISHLQGANDSHVAVLAAMVENILASHHFPPTAGLDGVGLH